MPPAAAGTTKPPGGDGGGPTPSLTTWNRIEPRVRSATLGSLAARIYDPVWLLARQWQVGEFAAEDAGSPVSVELLGASARLTYVALGTARPGDEYSPDAAPLEAVVEAEPAIPAGALDLRLRARAGQWWLAALDEAGLQGYRTQYLTLYPLPGVSADADAASARTASVLGGRCCDGVAVGAAMSAALASGTLPPSPAFATPAQQAAAMGAAEAFVSRLSTLLGPPTGPAAWAEERFEYQAAVAGELAGREHALVAPEHRGGRLDWYAFDIDTAGGVIPMRRIKRPPHPPHRNDPEFPRYFQPQPARFAGMPRPRYWELEDGNVNFGAVETGPTDLTRLLLIEYALVYGNDYFVVPLSLPVGTICEVQAVIVRDTFGGTWSIPSVATVDGANGPFKLFTHALDDPNATAPPGQTLLVPPMAGAARPGRPVERVRFVRDEPAEMAWGIEETVQGAAGRPVQRPEWQRQLDQAAREQAPPPPPGDELTYELLTPPPAWWLPLVPHQTTTTSFRFRVEQLPAPSGTGTLGPRGLVLGPTAYIAEEEIPRTGVDVARAARRTRWIGGSTAAWIARRTRPGRVEGSSGLTWDSIDPTP
jgi:hypothetical protein